MVGKGVSTAARVAAVALVIAAVLVVLSIAGISIRLAYAYLADRCLRELDSSCSASLGDKAFAAGQVAWALGGAGLALFSCANWVRLLAAGERTERLARHTLLALGLLAAWLAGPLALVLAANA